MSIHACTYGQITHLLNQVPSPNAGIDTPLSNVYVFTISSFSGCCVAEFERRYSQTNNDCVYVCMYGWMYVCIYVWMDVCMYVSMNACMHTCMYVYMYVCMYVCMHTSIHACVRVYVCACVSLLAINVLSCLLLCKTVCEREVPQ